MRKENPTEQLSRRKLLKLGAGLVGAAAAGTVLPRALLRPSKVKAALSADAITPMGVYRHFAASDGWAYLPGENLPYHPDNLAPDGLTTYIFGFRDVTSLDPLPDGRDLIFQQKMKCQLTSPMFWLDEWRGTDFESVTDFTLKLTNLGLQVRPDLIDAHTLHFHGFRNAIPIFDGEPHSSVGVPISRDLTYFYRARDPGTYMYHCHFEETEHVHMGMVGGVFVRPRQNFSTGGFAVPPARLGDGGPDAPAMGYVYNDGDGSTAYDREFVLVMNEVWTLAHWCDSHVQLPEWSDYNPDIYLMNGRVYPDTIAPNGGYVDGGGELYLWEPDPATGDMVHTERPELRYQPLSSLITCNAGDRVLVRFINLGYVAQSMRLTGIKMRVVGRDATLLRGRDGKDQTYLTDSLHIGAGQSVDAIVDVPDDITEFTKLLLFSRNLAHLSNPGSPGLGGPMTEFHIHPAGTLGPQVASNDWGVVL